MNNFNRFLMRLGILAGIALGWSGLFAAHAQETPSKVRFEVSFSDAVRNEATTGRMFVAISPTLDPEPRIAAYNSARRRDARVPFFAVDVDQLKPGQPAVIDATSIGFPYMSLSELPAGDYYVQGVLNVYTQFHRADGHVIWAHMDQWEGQRWGFSPGNLLSEPQKVHLDPNEPMSVKIVLTKVLPPIEVPPDTEWVKRIKIQSKILTEFWGHPMYLGATVLLPKGYAQHPEIRYPVVYAQSHFSLSPAFDFATEQSTGPNLFAGMEKQAAGLKESGYEFYQSWNSDDFPRMIAVTFQHPTPYFDDSYAVNSANNGPYGDAIMKELIPYLEARFRMIPKPYARVLTGGSTGGWESLALQVYHPEFFGGTWTMYPDPVDFRKYGMLDAYTDDNAFIVPNAPFNAPERMFQRNPDGQPVASVRQISQMEYASGTHDRSGAQIDIWDAVYGPVGDDGYPQALWNHLTGKIDHSVANYMRDHGYDLRDYIQTNWPKIGPDLVGKLRIYCGDMDNFYLAGAVYLLEDFLKTTTAPAYAGEFVYGRPMKGHGWQPMTNAELIRMMADHIAKNAPAGENIESWKGK
ncbi:MAG: alpha/beta hydrolase-fold protein [Candidatus Acidiferrales bacterium]